jgi:hypothetical protein
MLPCGIGGGGGNGCLLFKALGKIAFCGCPGNCAPAVM